MTFRQEFINQAIFRLKENPPRIEKCLMLIEEGKQWYSPNDQTNSIGHLIQHQCGNARQYIISSLGGQVDQRQRSLEFTESHRSIEELIEHCRSTIHDCIKVLQTAEEGELLKSRMVQGFEMTGIGVVTHVVEHFSYHTGQIALLTKLISAQDLGFYEGLDLEVNN